ncbi:zinc finger protein 6 [Prunus dulcis]|uniref:Zinc finger protein 6 n=1 Tax=Prunus dulcis TaxID=3755 RepID=A0A4Y1RTZ7_PRUDU|nr:zinc finger protein 6 [Prunus dulcis]
MGVFFIFISDFGSDNSAQIFKSHGTALNLGASGINPTQIQQLPLLSEYVEPLMKLMVPNSYIKKNEENKKFTKLKTKEEEEERIDKNRVGASDHTGPMLAPSLSAPKEKVVIVAHSLSGVVLSIFLERLVKDWTTWTLNIDTPTSFLFGPKALAIKSYQLSPPDRC